MENKISLCLYLCVYWRLFTKWFISNSKSLISLLFHTFLIYCSWSSRGDLSRNCKNLLIWPKLSYVTIQATGGEPVSCTLIVDFMHLWGKDTQSSFFKFISACQMYAYKCSKLITQELWFVLCSMWPILCQQVVALATAHSTCAIMCLHFCMHILENTNQDLTVCNGANEAR